MRHARKVTDILSQHGVIYKDANTTRLTHNSHTHSHSKHTKILTFLAKLKKDLLLILLFQLFSSFLPSNLNV